LKRLIERIGESIG